MASFGDSSHFRSWLISESDIGYLQCNSSSSAITEPVIRVLPSKRQRVEEAAVESQINFEIVVARYCAIIQHHFGENSSTEGIAKKPWRVSATAIVYFRRFFLNNSLLTYDPRRIMVACIFLAGKVEDCYVHVEELIVVHKGLSTDDVLAAELVLIQGLTFHLKVFHPKNVMHTFLADYKRFCEDLLHRNGTSSAKMSEMQSAFRREWRAAAEKVLLILQRSRACLSYSPVEIAVCVLLGSENPSRAEAVQSLGSEATPPDRFLGYLEHRFGVEEKDLLFNQSQEIAKLIPIVETFDTDDEMFAQTMQAIKKNCTWDKKKDKSSKSSSKSQA